MWVGRNSTLAQRRLAMRAAQRLATQPDRPKWACVCRVVERGETILFKQHFSNYEGMLPINVKKVFFWKKIVAYIYYICWLVAVPPGRHGT